MPPRLHAALNSVTEAAAHLRTLLSELAAAVEREDPEIIVRCARALVASATTSTLLPDSPDTPETHPGPNRGESP